MSSQGDPFQIQPVLSDLFVSHDLLDLTSSSPTQTTTGTVASNLLSSVSQLAAGVTHRASPGSGDSTPLSASPQKAGAPADSAPNGTAPANPEERKPEVRCVEGYANNLYVGGSDGVLEWWVYDGSPGTSENRGWKLRHKHVVNPRRSITKIVLLPKVSRALILAEGILHPLSLPNLEPLPPNTISPIRGVVSVALNDDELDLAGNDGDGVTDMTVVVVRRKGLAIYRLGTRMILVKEIPLPAPPRYHALFSTFLCVAAPSEGGGLTYSVIDISDASMTEVLPVTQVPPEDESWNPNPNVVVIPGENQFLVTSYTGSNTMGVFLNGQGDPERGTMEWQSHPISITVESGFIIALLRNNTIAIHSLNELDQPAQTISLDPALEIRSLSYSPYGISIRDVILDKRLSTSPFTLLSGKLTPLHAEKSPSLKSSEPEAGTTPDVPRPEAVAEQPPSEEPEAGSGLTPPSSPKFKRQPIVAPNNSSLLSQAGQARGSQFSSAIAETLLIGPHTVCGLTPTSIVVRLEQLCDERRMDEAMTLVDDERRKGRRGEIEADKTSHSVTMKFLHSYLAFNVLLETVFERAEDYFIRAKIDPRLIVRLFPKYRGKLIGTAEEVEVFDGLRSTLEKMDPIEDIIADFLSRSAEGQVIDSGVNEALYDSAKESLTSFLQKTRNTRRNKGPSSTIDARKVDMVVDTTLAKLLAENGTTDELLSLLGSVNEVVFSELEPFLYKRKYILATVLLQQGRVDRVLELLKEIAEDPVPDPLCPDPVGELVQHLNSVEDPEELRDYTLWLIRRDPEKGLNFLLSKGSKLNLDDAQIVQDIASVDEGAANRYLEHVVVDKKSADPELHEALLKRLLDGIEELLKDDGINYHLEELDAEYRLQAGAQAYAVFFADVAPDTPFKTNRLKLMLFLQTNTFYDLNITLARLENSPPLTLERAIVLGRLGRHESAMRVLASELADPMSAQTYCTQGGEIVPPKVAHVIATKVPSLAAWADLYTEDRPPVDASTQHKLVVELLRAYMYAPASKGKKKVGGIPDGAARAQQLLSAQGVHLDVKEVLEMAPNEWPFDSVNTFYTRSYRRLLHERTTWQILKHASAGQNLETSVRYLEAMSQIPPVAVDRGDGGGDQELDEKAAGSEISEKDAKDTLAEGGDRLTEKSEVSTPDPDPAAKELRLSPLPADSGHTGTK